MRYSTTYGGFEIESCPAQPQLALCHSFFVLDGYRGKGNGTHLKQHQLDILQAELYDYAICTVVGNNIRQIKILNAAGWTSLATFYSRRLGTHVHICGIHIKSNVHPQHSEQKPAPGELMKKATASAASTQQSNGRTRTLLLQAQAMDEAWTLQKIIENSIELGKQLAKENAK